MKGCLKPVRDFFKPIIEDYTNVGIKFFYIFMKLKMPKIAVIQRFSKIHKFLVTLCPRVLES